MVAGNNAAYFRKPIMKFKFLLQLMCFCFSMPLLAQTALPSSEQMIEQLKAPKLRNLRNLMVEAAPATQPASTPEKIVPDAQAVQAEPELPNVRPSLSLLIQFEFGSARVRAESRQALLNLTHALQSTELLNSNFAIEGHTDAKGSVSYNQRLSQQRADAVREFLTSNGVAVARLTATGKGFSELAQPDQPFAAVNRRVRVVNLE
jgi:outer membrane protein OmpA-like peptidoglycan-associated protein